MRKPPIPHKVKPKNRRYRPAVRRDGYMRGHGKPRPPQHGGRNRNVRPRLQAHEERLNAQRARVLSKRRITRKDLRTIHRARSKHAQRVDEALMANQTEDLEKWAKHPNRCDVIGVDYFPVPFTNNFRFNTQAIGYAMEQYYGVSTANVPVRRFYTDREYAKAYGGGWRSAYAFHDPRDDSINFSPRASKILTKGELESTDDLFAYSSIVHEYGHAIGDVKDVSTRSFDEGSNELLAHRFALLSLQLEPSERKYFHDESHHSYLDETRIAGAVALIANDYDENKAVDWLKNLRSNNTPKNEKERMIYEAEMRLVDEGVLPERMRTRDFGVENAREDMTKPIRDGLDAEAEMRTCTDILDNVSGAFLYEDGEMRVNWDNIQGKRNRAYAKKWEKAKKKREESKAAKDSYATEFTMFNHLRRDASPLRGSMTNQKRDALDTALKKHDRNIYDRWWLDA